jgi:predicted nucleotidyltransferase
VEQKQQLDSIREKYKSRLVLAFGSRIRGIVHQDSDLDLSVLYEDAPKPFLQPEAQLNSRKLARVKDDS